MELCQGRSDVNHRCSFADSAFEVNECQDSGAHEDSAIHISLQNIANDQAFLYIFALGVRRSEFGQRPSKIIYFRQNICIGFLENAERRTPNAERRTPNAERRTPNAERRTPNAERRTP
jgi:hypothetical protein